MTDRSPTTPANAAFPKGKYGVVMGAVSALAAGAAWGIAIVLGGDQTTAMLALGCVACASVATFLPLLFGKDGNFGVMVLVASMVRMLMLLGLAVFFAQTREVAGKAYWVGILTGGGVVLAVETALAVTLLNRMERHKAAGPVARH